MTAHVGEGEIDAIIVHENEFVIRFPLSAAIEKMQDFIDYLRYKELTANCLIPIAGLVNCY
jgi:hypothetical protein